jgi:hypothetical protein
MGNQPSSSRFSRKNSNHNDEAQVLLKPNRYSVFTLGGDEHTFGSLEQVRTSTNTKGSLRKQSSSTMDSKKKDTTANQQQQQQQQEQQQEDVGIPPFNNSNISDTNIRRRQLNRAWGILFEQPDSVFVRHVLSAFDLSE